VAATVATNSVNSAAAGTRFIFVCFVVPTLAFYAYSAPQLQDENLYGAVDPRKRLRSFSGKFTFWLTKRASAVVCQRHAQRVQDSGIKRSPKLGRSEPRVLVDRIERIGVYVIFRRYDVWGG
jgi:hypothetical protein